MIVLYDLPLPPEVAGHVTDVTWDSCEPGYHASTNDLSLSGLASAPTCTIVVSLDDGAALSAVAKFDQVLTNGCGPFYLASDPLPISPFEYAPGGAPPCSR